MKRIKAQAEAAAIINALLAALPSNRSAGDRSARATVQRLAASTLQQN